MTRWSRPGREASVCQARGRTPGRPTPAGDTRSAPTCRHPQNQSAGRSRRNRPCARGSRCGPCTHIENINSVPPFRLGLEKRGVGLLRHLEAAAVLSIVQIHVHVLAPAPLVPIPPAAGRARGERIIQNPLSVVVFIKATQRKVRFVHAAGLAHRPDQLGPDARRHGPRPRERAHGATAALGASPLSHNSFILLIFFWGKNRAVP